MSILKRTIIGMVLSSLAAFTVADEQAAERPSVTALLSGQLERVENTEFIVSRVQIPPNSSLPKHWHPGEEFVYVMSGRVTLWQEGRDEIVFAAGDAGQVPLKQIHTAITGDEGVDLIVFRVHEKGKPERILIDEP